MKPVQMDLESLGPVLARCTCTCLNLSSSSKSKHTSTYTSADDLHLYLNTSVYRYMRVHIWLLMIAAGCRLQALLLPSARPLWSPRRYTAEVQKN
jgi:hypothetical protein